MARPKQMIQKIPHSLEGSWQSVRSTIPSYRPGGEWLHFTADGEAVWEIGHRLLLVKDGAQDHPLARIGHLSDDEIQVAPHHGFVTIFRKAEKSDSAEEPR